VVAELEGHGEHELVAPGLLPDLALVLVAALEPLEGHPPGEGRKQKGPSSYTKEGIGVTT